MTNTNNILNTGTSTDTTNTTLDLWSDPVRVDIIECPDRIEMIYKETALFTYTESLEIEVKVFKIVYSCVDGKWNKSDPIYGEVIPATKEGYEFE